MEDLTNTCGKYLRLPASAEGFMASVNPLIYRILQANQLEEQKITLNPGKAQLGPFDWNFALILVSCSS